MIEEKLIIACLSCYKGVISQENINAFIGTYLGFFCHVEYDIMLGVLDISYDKQDGGVGTIRYKLQGLFSMN